MNQASNIKNYTRGGQITLHNIRMFIQITNKVTLLAGLLFLLVTACVAWMSVSPEERFISKEYIWSTIIPFFNDQAVSEFKEPNGNKVKVKYSIINRSSSVKAVVHNVSLKVLRALCLGLMTGIISMIGMTLWLRRRGEAQTEDVLLKGDKICSTDETRKIIRHQQQHSDLILAQLPLIKSTETAHLLFHGTTGSGKSNAIKELLEQIRARGDRAIIYDKSCNFLEEFFLPGKDILLNPLDNRGMEWDLWRECRDSADFDSLAAAQIPMPLSTQDPFWINAARTIFAAAAFEMRDDPDRSIMKLLRYLLTADLDVLQQYLKGTEAETLVSEKIEKTAISIKSVLATYLKSLKYVKEGEHPFSIRQWVQDDKAKQWLFVTSLGDRHETLKPLISSWLDIAVNALLSLAPNPDRRIWLILDELTSLQPLPYLTQTLSESRKFGGCIVIGIQNYAQLSKLYGQDGAREISALLNTRFMFRQPDPDMARWAASNFGESIMDEIREGTSYGANTMRDGITINRAETRKPLISYSEIMSLSNLFAYVRLSGDFPITRVHFSYKERKKPNMGFQARAIDERRMKTLKEVDELMYQQEKITDGMPDKKTHDLHETKKNNKKHNANNANNGNKDTSRQNETRKKESGHADNAFDIAGN